jgi:hypothetical protein
VRQQLRLATLVLPFVLAAVFASAGAAQGDAQVRGHGAATMEALHVRFVLHATALPGGAGEGQLSIGFADPDSRQHFSVAVNCVQVDGDLAIVGGRVRNRADSPNGAYSHVAVLIRDRGSAGDLFETIRFVGADPSLDACAFARSVQDLLVYFPLQSGDVRIG